jgi:molybdopterin-synthase adenylyltransferase
MNLSNSLLFAGDELRKLRSYLLDDSPSEAAALLLGGSYCVDHSRRVLIREVIPVPLESYDCKSASRIVVKPIFLAEVLKRARDEQWSVIFAHSHPHEIHPRFSSADNEGEQLLIPTFFQRVPNSPHGSLVLGRQGFDSRLWLNSNQPEVVSELREIGADLTIEERETSAYTPTPQFDRSIRAFGEEGQRLLENYRFGIVGLGGIGSAVVQQLAHLGANKFVLVDPDVVETTNLNRLIGARNDDVGHKKVNVAATFIRSIRPKSEVIASGSSVLHREGAMPLLQTDFIFCCTDTQGSRAVLNQLAYQYFIPIIDVGVSIDASSGKVTTITGRVQMLAPGLPCLVCEGLLNPEQVRRDLLSPAEQQQDPYIIGVNQPQPAVISINGAAASSAVTMMLAALTGLPMKARHQVLRGEQGNVRAVAGKIDPYCVVSSRKGALGRGDGWNMPWRLD